MVGMDLRSGRTGRKALGWPALSHYFSGVGLATPVSFLFPGHRPTGLFGRSRARKRHRKKARPGSHSTVPGRERSIRRAVPCTPSHRPSASICHRSASADGAMRGRALPALHSAPVRACVRAAHGFRAMPILCCYGSWHIHIHMTSQQSAAKRCSVLPSWWGAPFSRRGAGTGIRTHNTKQHSTGTGIRIHDAGWRSTATNATLRGPALSVLFCAAACCATCDIAYAMGCV